MPKGWKHLGPQNATRFDFKTCRKIVLHFKSTAARSFLIKGDSISADKNRQVIVETSASRIRASYLINCAGLHSDRIASLGLGKGQIPFQIIPFRGEYWELVPSEEEHRVRGLIYPVPDPRFPFLGVHLSRMVDGKVLAGPNAVLALAREGYKKSQFNLEDFFQYLCYPGFWKMAARYWDVGWQEVQRSLRKKVFVKQIQRLLPQVEEQDFIESFPAFVRKR